MNLNLPLADLVSKVDGAFGAILADSDGESVVVFSLPDQVGEDCYVGDERIKLIGAYQTITLRACHKLAQQFHTGSVTHLVCHYDATTILVRTLKNDYALILAMQAESNVGQGMFYLEEAAEIISHDL